MYLLLTLFVVIVVTFCCFVVCNSVHLYIGYYSYCMCLLYVCCICYVLLRYIVVFSNMVMMSTYSWIAFIEKVVIRII